MTKDEWKAYKTKNLKRKGRKIWENPMNTPEMKAKYNGATWPDLSPGEELPHMGKQEFKAECDVNTIVNQYMKTGDTALLNAAQKYYGDVSQMPTNYHEALNQVELAKTAFEALPSKVREKFNHDPGALIEFVKKAENYDQASELGLVPKREVPKEPNAPGVGGAPGTTGTVPPAPKP